MAITTITRMPTQQEIITLLTFISTQHIFISDDDQYEMRELEFPAQTAAGEKLFEDLVGIPLDESHP